MNKKLKILHLEDMPADAELVEFALKRSTLVYEKLVVDNKADYINAIKEFEPDIVLSDHSLPDIISTEAFKILKKSGLNIPFILITATISEEFAVQIMKDGASDYILKDRMQRLPNAILNALEKFKLDAERQTVNNELNLLFNTIDEVFFSRDVVNAKMIQISPACEKLYGYPPADFFTDPKLWSEIVFPEDRKLKQEVKERLRQGEITLSRYRIIHKNKNICWVESKAIPSFDENGELVRVYGVTRDITARKEAEEQLQEAAETQAAILNALPPSIVLVNEKGKISAVNDSWKKLVLENNLGMPNYGVGYSYLAISAKATGVDTLNSYKIEQGIKEVIQGSRKEFTMEYASLTGKDWFLIVATPLADKTHNGAVILHINITDRKLAEASLQKSEVNLRSVVENIDLSIVLCDTDLKVVSYNSQANDTLLQHFNKPLKTGNAIINYFPSEKRAAVKKAIALVNEKKIAAYETTFLLPDDTKEWYDVKWVGVMNQKHEQVGVILTFKNITEKKNIDFERESMTADLAQRNNDLEQFTYIVSHNLRAPVANIQGLALLLGDIEPGNQESLDTLHALSTSVSNLDKVILDLNNILQVRSQVNDQIEIVSLPLLVEEIRKGIDQMMAKNKVTLSYDFDAMDEMYILKSYLYSIFQNLVINSIKYRRTDVNPVIKIRSKVEGDKVYIYFKDNGKGIDLEKHGSHIFGLYKRFDWSVEGKGIGLFMVKMQVESLGGTISVKSKPDAGTEFILEFPLAVEQFI
jgi:PAS domain S-box-containing protein